MRYARMPVGLPGCYLLLSNREQFYVAIDEGNGDWRDWLARQRTPPVLPQGHTVFDEIARLTPAQLAFLREKAGRS